MDKILLIPIFVPLVAGVVLLFVPNRIKLLHKAAAMLVSILAFVMAVSIFRADQLDYAWSILQIDNLRLDLLLTTTFLSKFILLFAMGFGLLISLYSLKAASVKRPNIYYGSILLTIGGAAGILLSNHLLFMLIFWEIVTVSLYLLIIKKEQRQVFLRMTELLQ